MGSTSGMMQALQNKWARREDDGNPPNQQMQTWQCQQNIPWTCEPPRRELGLLEGVKFIFSPGQVPHNDFPTHIFGIPTKFCLGDAEGVMTSRSSYNEEYDEYGDPYYDENENDLEFAPRGRDFLSDLSTILEVTTALTRQDTGCSLESVLTSKSKAKKVVVTGLENAQGRETRQQPEDVTEINGGAGKIHSSLAYIESEHILANSTSSHADNNADPQIVVRSSACKEAENLLVQSISSQADNGGADPRIDLSTSKSRSGNRIQKMPSILEEQDILALFSIDSDGEVKEGQYMLGGKMEDAKNSFERAWIFGGALSKSKSKEAQRSKSNDKAANLSSKILQKDRSIRSQLSSSSMESRKKNISCQSNLSSATSGTDERDDGSVAQHPQSILEVRDASCEVTLHDANSNLGIQHGSSKEQHNKDTDLALKLSRTGGDDPAPRVSTPRPKSSTFSKGKSTSQKSDKIEKKAKKTIFGKKKV
jgi:hypothetical protein